MFRHTMYSLVTCAAILLLSGCDDSDASNVKIELRSDFSGTLRATRLVIAPDATTTQAGNSGITWSHSAQVVTATGTFGNLADVRIEDITFSSGSTTKGLNYLRVTLPRGELVKWPTALTVTDPDRRTTTHKAVFPDQPDSKLGSVIAISITLPAEPISHGTSPRLSAVKESVDKKTITLSIPASLAVKAGDPIVWDVTWNTPTK